MEGCKADVTITQLNLIAKTLHSATDSLTNSLKDIQEKNGTNALQDSRNDSDGTTTNGPSSNTQSNTSSGQLLDVPSNGSSATESLDESKKELQQSLDKADKLVNKLGKDETLTLTGRKLLSALSKAVDSGQKLIENSNIKDSKYYKAAKVTLMMPSMWPRIGWTTGVQSAMTIPRVASIRASKVSRKNVDDYDIREYYAMTDGSVEGRPMKLGCGPSGNIAFAHRLPVHILGDRVRKTHQEQR